MSAQDFSVDSKTPNSPPQVVDRDLSCVRCGYNLRMLPPAGRCPECGTPVALSTALGTELAKSRPAYVRRLSRACWLLFLARALPFGGVLGELLFGDSGWTPLVFLPLAVLAYSLGLWLLASREHPHLPPELRWTSRALRLASLIFLVCLLAMSPGLLVLLGSELSPSWQSRPQSLPAAISWLFSEKLLEWSAIVCFGVYVLCPVMETRLMVHLARRLANAWLGEHALIAGIGTLLSGAAWAAVMYWQPDIAQTSGMLTGAAAVISLLLFWLWMAVCSWIAARGFSCAAREAGARWRQSEAAADAPR